MSPIPNIRDFGSTQREDEFLNSASMLIRHQKPKIRKSLHSFMKTLFITTAITLLACALLHAEGDPFAPIGPNENPGRHIPKVARIQIEFIEVPHEDLTRILNEDDSGVADSSQMRKVVHELVERNRAKIIDTQVIQARSGEVARARSTHPTENDLIRNANEGGEEGADPAPNVDAPIAAAFEAPPVISFTEITPTIRVEGKTINLAFRSELVTHGGNSIWRETKDENGKINKTKFPNLYKLSIENELTFITGQTQLVAVLSPQDNQGNTNTESKVMVFVKCTILPVGKMIQ